MTKEIVCINCPMGCRLTVTIDGDQVTDVQGNVCAKGPDYAKQEAINPMRILTSLMPCTNRDRPLSVKTSAPISKKLIFDCVNAIYSHPVTAPIKCGDVIIHDLLGTGADVVATQDIN